MDHSSDSGSSVTPIKDMKKKHGDVLKQAIENVISSPVAEVAYGQIIDGMLLSESAFDVYNYLKFSGHPLIEEHLKLSEEVLRRVRDLHDSFRVNQVSFPSSLVLQFQAAAPGSRAFNTHLIEMVARAVHHIAVTLYEQGHIRPDDDQLLTWRPCDLEDPEEHAWAYRGGFPPTYFYHEWYTAYNQYPHGVADAVGYWAENKILGGVVLFDRREPGSAPNVDPNAIYFHTDARGVTYRIYRLLDTQKQDLINFLVYVPASGTTPPPCPLPIHADAKNRIRIDPEEAMKETGIYRDKWEREPPTIDKLDSRSRDVIDTTFDYLSRDEFIEAALRASRMRSRLYADEDLGWTTEDK